MSTIGWLLVVAVAIALGFSAGRLWPGSSARLTALERERNAAREDLQNYREEVSQHFERTAELFDKVTSDYRNLYEHLARSERQLGAIRGESAGSSLAQPEQRRLAASAPTAVDVSDEDLATEDTGEIAPGDAGKPGGTVSRADKDDAPAADEAHDEADEPHDEADEARDEADEARDGADEAHDRADETGAVRPGQ